MYIIHIYNTCKELKNFEGSGYKKLIAKGAVGLPNKDNLENLCPQVLPNVTLRHLIAIQLFQDSGKLDKKNRAHSMR